MTLSTGMVPPLFFQRRLMHPSQRVGELAKKKGISMAQVAVAWCLSKEGVTAPIVGTTKLENLQDIIGDCRLLTVRAGDSSRFLDALDVTLTDDEIKYLEDAYQTRKVLGHT